MMPRCWRNYRADRARYDAALTLFKIARYCISEEGRSRGALTREEVAVFLQRHPWVITDYVLEGKA